MVKQARSARYKRTRLAAKALCLAVAAAFAETAAAQVLPIGGTVASGSATIGSSGGAMTVTQTSERAVLNWSSFNIGDGASVSFVQPGATSIAVNRVTGGAGPSAIDGMLSANGNVMILNPNGVLFGAAARVHVGGLIASTGNVDDTAFMDGGPFAISGATAGVVSNQGEITVAGAGLAAFVAPAVSNSGLIKATGGRIVLASAQAATVSLNGGLYEIAVNQGIANGAVANTGTLMTGTAAGSIVLSALDAANVVSGLINLEGIQQASRIEVHGGEVVLKSDLDARTVAGTSNVIRVSNGAQIQDAVDIAKVSGASVTVAGGTYVQASTLNVSKSLTLAGAGQGETLIDARGVGSYGLSVSADNVTLSDFTLYGPAAFFASAYGIKVSPGGPASSRLRNFTIRNVTSRGAGKAELDLNGVDGALIDRVTAEGAPAGNDAGTTQGAGIQLTDSANVTVRDSTTRNNAWGGVAIYQANRSYDQQTANITVEGNNAFHETNPLYLQDESATRDFGTLALHGFNYAVRNSDTPSHNDQYTWLQYTLGGAVDLAVNVAAPGASYVRGWHVSAPTRDFHVGVGSVAGGGTRAMSIAKAVGAADSGASVHVGAGSYAENLVISKALTLDGAGIGQTVLQSSTPGSGTAVAINNASGVTLSDLSIRDYQYGLTLGGTSHHATVERVAFGGNTYALRTGTTTRADNFRMLDSSISGGLIGVQTYNGVSGGSATGSFASALFQNVSVDGPSYKGFYFETADNLVLRNVTITNTGNSGGQDPSQFQKYGHAVDINLKYAAFDSITFDNLVVRNSGRSSGDATRAAVAVKTRGVPGDSATYVASPASLQRVDILGGSIEGSDGVAIRFEDLSNGAGGKPTVVVGGGMQFRNNGQDILVGAANVDATGAAFVDAADGFAVEDRVTHGLDHAGRGLVTWHAGNFYVTQASGSVQRGINAASAGDTVNVGAGTFAEQLAVTKSLFLRGAGANDSVIAPTSLTADASGMRNILTIGGGPATGAQVSGFTFKGPVPQINAGIFVRDGAHARIHDNRLIDMRESAALSGNQRGQAIFVGRAALGTSGTAVIENNVITGYQKGGIVVDGPGSQATITGNTVIGEGPTGVTAQNGIQASRGASATIAGNAVSGNHYTGNDEAVGILIFTPGFYLGQGAIRVGRNAVSGNEVGIWTNDPRTLRSITLAGVSGNARNAVADFAGGYPGQGINLEYPAWAPSNEKRVDARTFGGRQAGDILDVGGALRVSGWNGFAAIESVIGQGGSLTFGEGTLPETVVAGLREPAFRSAPAEGPTIDPAAARAGTGGGAVATGASPVGRSSPGRAGDALDRGAAVELDLAPGNE